jgi:SPP1 family predicted phage head-tail adaptor
MRAGQQRERVTIQKPVETAAAENAFGEIDLTSEDANWQTHATRWAGITPTAGREFVSGEQVQADVTHVVVLRYDSKTELINTRYRLKRGAKYLNIMAAYPKDNRNREFILQCQEVV